MKKGDTLYQYCLIPCFNNHSDRIIYLGELNNYFYVCKRKRIKSKHKIMHYYISDFKMYSIRLILSEKVIK
jgi:hypothetical protein